jgi:hypothetical protein
MGEQDRWNFLLSLDEELLRGGAVLSEWCAFLTRESDGAFADGLYLASILTAMSAIETHLRSEDSNGKQKRLVELIDSSGLESELMDQLHTLRKYRNKWVHVADPWEDQALIENPKEHEDELEKMAILGVKALRQTIYSNPWV